MIYSCNKLSSIYARGCVYRQTHPLIVIAGHDSTMIEQQTLSIIFGQFRQLQEP